MNGMDSDGWSATKLIFPLFILLGLLVMVGVPFLISIFILIFLGAIFLFYKNKTEIVQRFPSLPSLTAKIPWTAIGIIVAIIIVVVVAVKFWPFDGNGGGDVFRPKNGLQEWEGNGVVAKLSCYDFSSGGKITKKFDLNGIDVKLFGVSSESESRLVVYIKDMEGYGRSATFHYLIKNNEISFEEASYFNENPKNPKPFSSGVTDGVISNYVMSSVDKKIVSFAIGDENTTKTYSSSLSKHQQRDEPVLYEITIENQGESSLEIERIEIDPG